MGLTEKEVREIEVAPPAPLVIPEPEPARPEPVRTEPEREPELVPVGPGAKPATR